MSRFQGCVSLVFRQTRGVSRTLDRPIRTLLLSDCDLSLTIGNSMFANQKNQISKFDSKKNQKHPQAPLPVFKVFELRSPLKHRVRIHLPFYSTARSRLRMEQFAPFCASCAWGSRFRAVLPCCSSMDRNL